MNFSRTFSKKCALLLALALPFNGIVAKPRNQDNQEEIVKLFTDPQITPQVRAFVLEAQLPALLSKLETLNLVISNGTVKLTSAEKQHFIAATDSIKKEFSEHAQTLLGTQEQPISDLMAITNGLLLSVQLIDYLQLIVNKGLKKLPLFIFKPSQQELSAPQLAALFQLVGTKLKALENSFDTLGLSTKQKIARSLGNTMNRYGVVSKAKAVGFITLAALVARYMWKGPSTFTPNPLAQPQEDVQQSSDTMTGDATEPAVPQQPSRLDFLRNKLDPVYKAALWIDEHVVGTWPRTMIVEHTIGEQRIKEEVRIPGKGLGWIHSRIMPLAALASFPLLFKKQFDEAIEGISTWKSLQESPTKFLRLDEILKNKKDKVTAYDKLFISSAIEITKTFNVTFDDVAGLEEQKKALQPVIDYLVHPEIFERTGTTIETGYLFYGPTRTGKTHLAEALAGELALKHKKPLSFIKIRGNELSNTGGPFGADLEKVLAIVSEMAPCIVFIDELDLLNLQRDASGNTKLSQFLTGMKQDRAHKQVIFLAATNRVDHIDNALLQPGRFGKTIPFENPSYEDRKKFFIKELSHKNLYDSTLIDIEQLVKETEGCSFGELSSIVNHALTKATTNRELISSRHFSEGIDVVKRKISNGDINLPQEERALIAAHLAGHALAYHLLPTGEKLDKVTMLPIQKKILEEKIWMSNPNAPQKITSFGDVFTLRKKNTAGFDSREEKINSVKALLAGHAAECVLLGSSSYSYHNEDNEAARSILETLVLKGIKKEHLSKEAANTKLAEVMRLYEQCEQEVTQFLHEHKGQLEKLASALNKYLTLTSDDIAVVIK